MSFESKTIENIYSGNLTEKYDFSLPPFFGTWKKKALNDSSIGQGDKVLVFCCGTGLDFPHILKKIGKDGKIIGIDFSADMLTKTREKIVVNNWENIELIEADVTKFEDNLDEKADAGVCTIGMSIIPEFKSAYHNLLSNVKEGGEIIIGDMQLASGWLARLNSVTISISKRYGGTYEGHKNSLELYGMMNRELTEVRKREFFFKSYYYSIGKKQ